MAKGRETTGFASKKESYFALVCRICVYQPSDKL